MHTLKSVFGRGPAPDPAGGARDGRFPDPLVRWEVESPPHSSPHSSPPRRLRLLGLGAFDASNTLPPMPPDILS